jgi:hypothetical protein
LLAVLRLALLRLALALLIARVALLIARLARVALLITRVAVLRRTLLITWCLLVARALAITRRTRLITWVARFTRRLIGAGNGGGGSAVFGTIIAVAAIITLVALVITGACRLTVLIVRDGIAVCVTTTAAAATTTTTTTTTFTWEGGIVRVAFTDRRYASTILRQIRDGGGVEDFRFGRGRVCLRSDQVAGLDLFRLVGRSGSGSNGSSAGFTSSRRTRRGEVSGEHALQRLDEIVFAEPAAILDLMFAGELSEVFDAECGEIRLIRHGSNSPAQTLRDARLFRRDEWPIYGLCC